MKKDQALIAMSGGVDSSVAAYLTLREGIGCVGGTMLLWDQSPESLTDARRVCETLGIPFHAFDRSLPFREQVVEPFIQCYEDGLTPNPCMVCNRAIKFGALLEDALALGCHWVVTGHYARIREQNGRYLLYKAADGQKDQSYFLAGLTQHQLSHSRFPLGELTKEQVRKIAQEQGFCNARKKDSQDICFVPDGDYMAFMKEYTGKSYPAGDYLDLQGQVVGRHCGAVCYTIGQRKGLGLAMGQPVYICGKDMAHNTVTVGPNDALFAHELMAVDCNWFPFPALTSPMAVTAKVRSRHSAQPATVYPLEDGKIRVVFADPQRAITPGQAVVLYDEDMVIGSGTII